VGGAPSSHARTMDLIILEHGFLGQWINIDTMIDLTALADTLLDNFVTVRFARIGPVWQWPQPLSDNEFHRLGHGMRTERLICEARRRWLRMAMDQAGYRRFIDAIEGDVIGDWRIHIFSAERGAVLLLPEITDGAVGPGETIAIDARAFIRRNLLRLEKHGRLAGGHPW
jgi:hypothetical protein